MHGSLERPGKSEDQIDRSWNPGLFALPAIVVIALVTLAIIKPTATNWVSEAVQAEFVGTNFAPDQTPTQIARPAMEIRTVGLH